jgi:predicted RNA-binding Zn-ribbon protein involved in translation (DUF1610 family)
LQEKREVTAHCHRCGRETESDRIAVRAVCPHCGAWLHCCRNCGFYAPGLANDCREPNAEQVADKEQGNFCDWFRPAAAAVAEKGARDARARLDALFAPKRPRG